MTIANLSLNDLKNGWHSTANGFVCNYCQATWPNTAPLSQRQEHLDLVHGGNRSQLLHLQSRYNTLTSKQQDLLTAFATGIKDQALAEQLQVAPSTIRHQKFTFREKAKQAKLYLATYETVFESPTTVSANDPTIAEMQLPSEDKVAHVLKAYFDFDHEPLQLKRWPIQQSRLKIVLARIIEEFPRHRNWSKATIDQRLKSIYFDVATLRRALIQYGYLTWDQQTKRYTVSVAQGGGI
ncbi:DUF2087 domain-containing protein [Lactiplantibacillus sp. WILCCON 0030]|uniref:DUF2087 domain-containing protein n=1 Tax=Lactiplantibacillus brownii TaxID=3069269 RepID=A0ABU1A8W3_9LACO|nr:DUF2087 domain-containing protein [Lactiplantibacillus brownii]MDQ7937360.1 DUF2087 domain-containing protein [Lactiplantibacillus brownii]